MNDYWSTFQQGIRTLDLGRELRFSDGKSDLLIKYLGLKQDMNVLECGSGTGALARKIDKWMNGKILLTGIDRDSGFIEYAAGKSKDKTNINFIEADVLEIPFADNSFDAVYSHTVIEHVPNKEFLKEQFRVASPKGRVSVMMTIGAGTINSTPTEKPSQTKREKELFKPIYEKLDEVQSPGKLFTGYHNLPRLFEEMGFSDIQINALALPVVIDDCRTPENRKEMMADYDLRTMYMDMIDMGKKLMKDGMSEEAEDELRGLINERYNQRIKFISEGRKIWDYSIYTVLIVSGRK